MRVSKDTYFDSKSFLKGDDIKDGQVVTIEKFEVIKTRIGERPVVRLKGLDTPLGLNATRFDQLLEKFGDETDKWLGKKITLNRVKVNNPQTNKSVWGIEVA